MKMKYTINFNPVTKLNKLKLLYRINSSFSIQSENEKTGDRIEKWTLNQFQSEDPIEQNQNLYTRNQKRKRN